MITHNWFRKYIKLPPSNKTTPFSFLIRVYWPAEIQVNKSKDWDQLFIQCSKYFFWVKAIKFELRQSAQLFLNIQILLLFSTRREWLIDELLLEFEQPFVKYWMGIGQCIFIVIFRRFEYHQSNRSTGIKAFAYAEWCLWSSFICRIFIADWTTFRSKECSYKVWKFIKCDIRNNIMYKCYWKLNINFKFILDMFNRLGHNTVAIIFGLIISHITFIPISNSFRSTNRNRKFWRIPLVFRFHSLLTNWQFQPIHCCMRAGHQSLGCIRHGHWHRWHINGFHGHPL